MRLGKEGRERKGSPRKTMREGDVGPHTDTLSGTAKMTGFSQPTHGERTSVGARTCWGGQAAVIHLRLYWRERGRTASFRISRDGGAVVGKDVVAAAGSLGEGDAMAGDGGAVLEMMRSRHRGWLLVEGKGGADGGGIRWREER
jgi:hypothetical protein